MLICVTGTDLEVIAPIWCAESQFHVNDVKGRIEDARLLFLARSVVFIVIQTCLITSQNPESNGEPATGDRLILETKLCSHYAAAARWGAKAGRICGLDAAGYFCPVGQTCAACASQKKQHAGRTDDASKPSYHNAPINKANVPMFLWGILAHSDECDNVLPAFKRYLTILSLLPALAFAASESSARASAVGTPTQSHPMVVRVGLVIRNIIAIDEVKETWQATGLLVAKWTDRSLRYRPRGRGQLFRELPANMWKPDFEFTNEASPTHFRFLDLYVEPDGTLTYTQAFSATLSTSSDLRRFPFDSQLLPLVVQASGDDLDRTILKPDRKESALFNRGYVGLAHWESLSLSERLGTVEGTAGRAKDVEFDLKVRRNSKSYVLKFIVPLLLLVIISWITFWLSHEEFKTKDQLQSAVATLLIVVAFNITASNVLPRTEYVTYIDALLFTCFIFVIISIASIVGIHLLQINYSAQRALVVRRLAGVVLPIAFLITQLILFFAFHIAG
jgi:hypothetical protein